MDSRNQTGGTRELRGEDTEDRRDVQLTGASEVAFAPNFRKRSYDLGGGIQLSLGDRTLIMGILNATPDSFSDGGRYMDVEAAVAHARSMVEQGADILDIGGESTRPGFDTVSAEEEIRRVVPVIAAVRAALPHIPLSIDTYKASTARAALEAGAHIINDIWGLKSEPDMAAVAAEYGCPVIVSHNRHARDYTDFVPDVLADLRGSIGLALAAGVAEDAIWVDPGIGFAKTYEDNLALLGRLRELTALGCPILLGTSRKRFIRQALDLPVDQVAWGTAATVALGIAHGAQIMRVHDVREMKLTALMADAIHYLRD
ncbi:dihydropteroate synthase [Paenibacillus sp. MY03]|uniref:dihydropteroate synthase n=1 Tax=Paenibacillus sp. MY03 TaxID=302980 RepID=UPI000B3C23C3|nr:dihydropteroate synthase [Paenibacillus sp. MY03]OUS69933.1 dihydropteroate synthase [Paenibacillus sp. MY03]